MRWFRPRWCRSRIMRGPLRRGVRVRGGRGSSGGEDGARLVHGLSPLIVSFSVKTLVPLDSCCECVGGDVGRRIILPRKVTTDFRGGCVKFGVGGVGCVGGCGELVGRVVELIVHGRVIDGGVSLHVARCRLRTCGVRRKARHSDLRW